MTVEEFPEPFRYWIADDVACPTLLRQCAASVPPADHPSWVRYWGDCESRKWAMNDPAALGFYWKELFDLLTDSGWIADWSARVGAGLQADPKLWGGGLQVTFGGGALAPHLDYAIHPSGLERRLSLVLYLSEARPGAGGETVLYDPEGRARAMIAPRFGRAVLFENSDLSYHGVSRLADHAPPRLTAAVYYLAEPRPGATRRRALFLPGRHTA